MPERTGTSIRLHPLVKAALEEVAAARGRSIGYLIEEMTVQFMRARLPGFEPGQQVRDADVVEEGVE
jgi:predicted transcriptional regulator